MMKKMWVLPIYNPNEKRGKNQFGNIFFQFHKTEKGCLNEWRRINQIEKFVFHPAVINNNRWEDLHGKKLKDDVYPFYKQYIKEISIP